MVDMAWLDGKDDTLDEAQITQLLNLTWLTRHGTEDTADTSDMEFDSNPAPKKANVSRLMHQTIWLRAYS